MPPCPSDKGDQKGPEKERKKRVESLYIYTQQKGRMVYMCIYNMRKKDKKRKKKKAQLYMHTKQREKGLYVHLYKGKKKREKGKIKSRYICTPKKAGKKK